VAGRIRDEDVALVRERVNIADVVGEYLQLRPAGSGSLKGLCPFHDEKSPSFTVSPSKGVFHCFGCQAGGDTINFVRRIDQLTFAEAVERLAAKAGITLRYDDEATGSSGRSVERGQRARILAANAAAEAFYVERLGSLEGQTGRTFLADRGFDATAAQRFSVGYAPPDWDSLVRHLRGAGFADDELSAAGLAIRGPRDLYDRFRGRLIWPIRDVAGDTVGFGARKLYDTDDGPKYLNTPETLVYKKSQALYAIELAKRAIAKEQRAVVVEGYTDVMACHLAGVETAVATCGTAFGAEHVKVLRRLLLDDGLNGSVVFTFDGDAAGQKAALRSFEQDQRLAAQTFVAIEPNGMDPCELRMAKGDEAVRTLIDTRRPLLRFVLESALREHDLDRPEGRVAALRAAAPIVARIKDRTLRPEYVRALSGWLGMDLAPVQQAVAAADRAPASGPPVAPVEVAPAVAPAVPRPDPRDRSLAVERELLKLALQQPGLVAAAGFDDLDSAAYLHPAYRLLAEVIAGCGGTSVASSAAGAEWVTTVSNAAKDDVVAALVPELVVEQLLCDGEPDQRYADEYVARMSERIVGRRIADAKSRLQRSDPDDAAVASALLTELVQLEQERRALLTRVAGGD
jgi:DNA primase